MMTGTMDIKNVQHKFRETLQAFLANKRKKYLFHPKSNAARIDKGGVISHRKYGDPVQFNKEGIKVVICGSQNQVGSGIEVTALRFIAECVIGRELYFSYVGVEPVDGDYGNTSFDNVKFVETDKNYVNEHKTIDFSLPSVGQLWYANNFEKVERKKAKIQIISVAATCPYCKSDDVFDPENGSAYIDITKYSKGQIFECNDCNKRFELEERAWK